MSKQQHLDQLSNLDKRIDSIQVEFEQLKKDTVEEIIYAMKETNIKIQDNIGDDTIDLETAKKLEDYGKIFRQLSAVEGYNNTIDGTDSILYFVAFNTAFLTLILSISIRRVLK